MSSADIQIVILSGAHLCRNPRVHKEADALARAGYRVEVLGAWTDRRLASEDRVMLADAPFCFTPVIDLTQQTPLTALRNTFYRARSWATRRAFRLTGRPSLWQFGLASDALARIVSSRQADLYIAHLEYSLVAALRLQRSGHRVMVDLEDWYSEDLLPEARQLRPIALLSQMESELLRHCAGATCPSQAMSGALAATYDCFPPVPLYNVFPWSERMSLDGEIKDRKSSSFPTIHWYSQTLGPGRGLEDLFAALPHLGSQYEIHLRGTLIHGFDAWLSTVLDDSERARVFVHETVPSDRLLSRIGEHDIGFAGEMKFSRSRDLTVTNKILQYLLAGLAVVASDTAGQSEVAAIAPGAVLLYPSGDAVALAAQLNSLLLSPKRLNSAKAAALQAAESVFCWERQQDVLMNAVERAVGKAKIGIT